MRFRQAKPLIKMKRLLLMAFVVALAVGCTPDDEIQPNLDQNGSAVLVDSGSGDDDDGVIPGGGH